VPDHIIPVYPGMPDSEFFSEANARASCAKHNRARGWQTYAKRELAGLVDDGDKTRRTIFRDYTRRGAR
jgi:hypothetical protein